MKNVHVFVPVFLYAVTMPIFQIKRTISSEKWCNYIITFFFSENAKNLGWSDDVTQRKKRGWTKKEGKIKLLLSGTEKEGDDQLWWTSNISSVLHFFQKLIK